jgi:hypothetical protein
MEWHAGGKAFAEEIRVPTQTFCYDFSQPWGRLTRIAFLRVLKGANYINSHHVHLAAKHHGYDCPIFLGVTAK